MKLARFLLEKNKPLTIKKNKMRRFIFFGKKAPYPPFGWWENFMSGHVKIGNVIIYGANAMCWAVTIKVKKWGFVCFSLPSLRRKKRGWNMYFYLSSDATPSSAVFYKGDKDEEMRAKIRAYNFGNYIDTNDKKIYQRLIDLNNKFDYFYIE